jgi:putative MATE family efflux protein
MARYDREILGLAVPALGALAAVSLADFLSYGTTAQIARLRAAGEDGRARAVAAQALWLSLATGALCATLLAVLGGPLLRIIGHGAGVHRQALTYLLLVAPAVPAQLIALAGEGCLRGLGDLRSPLKILIVANAANVVLEVLFVYGLGLGLVGSALGTLIAQLGMGIAFARRMLLISERSWRPELERMRPLLRTGGHLTARTVALLAAFTLASALAARMGTASLAAHQVGFELFTFLALVLDSIAIAGQILVAQLLGAGDAVAARQASARMIRWSVCIGCGFGAVLFALSGVGPLLFGGGPRVVHLGHAVWRLLALMQPVAGAVFAIDGILIGAGDTRYLAWAMAVAFALFVPAALAASDLTGLWLALNWLVLLRLLTLVPRLRQGRWQVVGAAHEA